jgi:hypothetical protein
MIVEEVHYEGGQIFKKGIYTISQVKVKKTRAHYLFNYYILIVKKRPPFLYYEFLIQKEKVNNIG